METLNPQPKESYDCYENVTKTATLVPPLGDKRDVAAMLKLSVRSIDNFIQEGCPVIKLSPRCCRFDLVEVKEWVKNRYSQQGRAKLA